MTTIEAGDTRTATITVTGGDGTTTAVLTVTAPDGTTNTPDATSADDGVTWTAEPYELTAAGEWVERWVVTGTGTGVQEATVLVAPSALTSPTGARVYATTTDYANALHAAPPAGARRALLEASRVVDEMLITAVYDTDDDGLPTDAAVIRTLRDATCAQAEYARATGDDNATGVADGGIQTFSLGKLSVTRGKTPGQSGGADSGLPAHWSPAAYRILAAEGLTTTEPWSY